MPTPRQIIFHILKFQLSCLLLGGGLLLLPGCGDSTTENATDAGKKRIVAPSSSIVNKPAIHHRTTDNEYIRQLFVALQAANLDENIDEFMKYYADSFPGREQKRKTTLQNWQKYDFGSLDFFIFSLKIDGEVAEAAVGWEIALLEKGATSPRLIEMTHQVKLIKLKQDWQILSLQ